MGAFDETKDSASNNRAPSSQCGSAVSALIQNRTPQTPQKALQIALIALIRSDPDPEHPGCHMKPFSLDRPLLFVPISSAMGLIHPGILLGLFAIAAPIAIHFIRSRKYQRVEIGALRFCGWPSGNGADGGILKTGCCSWRGSPRSSCSRFSSRGRSSRRRKRCAPADLEVIVLLDVSGSVSGPRFEAVRNAARETLAKIPQNAKVTVAEYADDVTHSRSRI